MPLWRQRHVPFNKSHSSNFLDVPDRATCAILIDKEKKPVRNLGSVWIDGIERSRLEWNTME